MSSEEARRLGVLIALQKKGYNLIEGDKPEIMTMGLGGGYILECNVKTPYKEWTINFNDGIETTKYPAKSEKVVFTYRKDSDKLIGEYKTGLKALGIIEDPEESNNTTHSTPLKRELSPEPKKKKNFTFKNRNHAGTQERVGMALPVVYPSEMKGSFMQFKQWTADNNVIPAGSEVIILDDDEYNYRVSIPQAHISFDIPVNKVEIIERGEVDA